MITDRKTANVLSGKTARACDGCSRKRARWFCAADDAFLCQSCDLSVHSANQLASRHERVRLQTASFKITGSDSEPAWHQGFTRKARTPRSNGHKSFSAHQQLMKNEEKIMNNPVLPLVPQVEEDGNNTFADDDDDGEDDDQLLYRVPVFDPFSAELCSEDMVTSGEGTGIGTGNEEENIVFDDLDNLPVFLSSDMDLADFAADVENLLGLDDEDSPDYTKDLGFLDCKEEDEGDDQKFFFNDQEKISVKVKDEQEVEEIMNTDCDNFDGAFDMGRESLDWSFDYESPVMTTTDEAEEEKRIMTVAVNSEERKEMRRSSSYLLRLNYEGVIDAWASQGSPWTSGCRPQVNPDDCWPHCLGTCTKDGHHYHPNGGMGGHPGGGGNNRAREERVLRYKEKRRNRLFSKKIRYEVRKLNAEKRPRMKGRFVKRTPFMANVFPYINK